MPSQLKSREELPWLYYPRSNSVRVINSHLGGGGGGGVSLAVNGKTPIAAWVPSLDTAGNGTTTLTDLIGANDGTLTNMDAATDWVADTGAGGVRALDFDGSNDYVIAPFEKSEYGSNFSIVFWVYFRGNAGGGIFQAASALSSGTPWLLLQRDSSTSVRWLINDGYRISHSIAADTWTHFGLTYDGTTWQSYLNGSAGSSYVGAIGTTAAASTYFANGFGGYANMRLDDARVFGEAIDASDISYLYNSGSGRGRTS